MNRAKKDSGFSLIEILIAVGLLGALSVWMMNIFSIQSKNEKTTATNMDIDSLGQEMRNILADGLSCEKTFKGARPNQDAAVNELQKVLSDGTIQKRFAVNEKRIGNSNLLITGYNLKTDETYYVPAGQKNGETVLSINYDRGAMVQGSKIKIFKVPLSLSLDDSGAIIGCHSLASTSSLESICTALGRSVDTYQKKCNPPTVYIKGDTPIYQKLYQRCEGGAGAGEHLLATWTANGSGTTRLSWSGLANDTQVIWKVYKNSDVISTLTETGISSEIKTVDIDVKKGDLFKHTVSLSGGVDGDCLSSGSFNVALDLLNM